MIVLLTDCGNLISNGGGPAPERNGEREAGALPRARHRAVSGWDVSAFVGPCARGHDGLDPLVGDRLGAERDRGHS